MSIIYVYLDHSNIWIGGNSLHRQRLGITTTPDQQSQVSWACDFARLYELLCPPDQHIGRSVLVTSTKPGAATTWRYAAEQAGFDVRIQPRIGPVEKQVDQELGMLMVDDAIDHLTPNDTVVLASGDSDFLPAIERVRRRVPGVTIRIVSWSHSLSAELGATADEVLLLDHHLDHLTHHRAA
ncbi:NYN domain-containing protein [Actinokineospora bangkokensis]|uniref:NYN domain-containing protein n=1 Tax=Actinokineospora bangkokensis TaxID=1193682 RepID=A0A1Q9LR25_9PSEU|nr:NYN domain-containing protein [Actinokineospora bangkokensis]OLR94441.1 hypothetical protein BJP25_11840 [Actinokineospora bangkokensis]